MKQDSQSRHVNESPSLLRKIKIKRWKKEKD